MELKSSIAFISDTNTLSKIDRLLNEETVLDHMIDSLDFIYEQETDDTYVYRVYCGNESWVNIYEIQTILEKNFSTFKADIIYANTDGSSYVEVISTSGNFDTYIDTDMDKIQLICESYGLEFYGADESYEYDEGDDYSEDEDAYY